MTAIGTVIVALSGLIVAIANIITPGCNTIVSPKVEPVVGLENFSGNYDYQSTPDDVNQGPLIDERGNRCYQFIGTLSIQKKFQREYSVNAIRLYCVTFENRNAVLKKIDPVEWEAKSEDVFIPQIGQEIIFLLTTKREPPNRGLIKASIKTETKDRKADIIRGSMLYLIPRNAEKKRNSPHWLNAKVEFRRKENIGDANYFIKENVYKDWFLNKEILNP